MAGAQEQCALITGASDGIGARLALRLAQDGVRCGLLARRVTLLEEVARQVRAAGGDALVLPADLTQRDQVAEAVRRFQEQWGTPELLILNAGHGETFSGTKLTADRVMHTLDVNLGGVVRVLEACLPGMLERQSGTVVALSSLAARRGLPTSAAYGASKAALDRLIESLRVELAPRGLRFLTVEPGFVRTAMTAKNRFQMPFLLEPEDAAERIVRAIRRHATRAAFPWPMTWIMSTIGLLPDWLYDPLLRRIGMPRPKREPGSATP